MVAAASAAAEVPEASVEAPPVGLLAAVAVLVGPAVVVSDLRSAERSVAVATWRSLSRPR